MVGKGCGAVEEAGRGDTVGELERGMNPRNIALKFRNRQNMTQHGTTRQIIEQREIKTETSIS